MKELELLPILRACFRKRRLFVLTFLGLTLGLALIVFMLPNIYVARTTFVEYGEASSHSDKNIDPEVLLQDVKKRFDFQEVTRAYRQTLPSDEVKKALLVVDPKDIYIDEEQENPLATEDVRKFDLCVEHHDPEYASYINELLAREILTEYGRTKRSIITETISYYERMLQGARDRMESLGRQLVQFKSRTSYNDDMVLRELNLAMDLESQIIAKKEEINGLTAKIQSLSARLASMDPLSSQNPNVMTSSDAYTNLLNEYNKLRAVYSESHPSVIRAKKNLDLLEQEMGASKRILTLREELERTQREYNELSAKYSSKHPDVIKAEEELRLMKQKISESRGAAPTQAEPVKNPVYVDMQAELESLRTDLASERNLLTELERRQSELQGRATSAPAMEKEFNEISNQYTFAMKEYYRFQGLLNEFQEKKDISTASISENFYILEQTGIPKDPESPNRPILLAVSVLFAMFASVVSSYFAHATDDSVDDPQFVRHHYGLPLLASIEKY